MKNLYWSVICILLSFQALAQDIGEITVENTFQQAALIPILEDLESQYSIRFYYQEIWFDDIKVTGTYDTSLKEFLSSILTGTSLRFYQFRQQQIIFVNDNPPPPEPAETKTSTAHSPRN